MLDSCSARRARACLLVDDKPTSAPMGMVMDFIPSLGSTLVLICAVLIALCCPLFGRFFLPSSDFMWWIISLRHIRGDQFASIERGRLRDAKIEASLIVTFNELSFSLISLIEDLSALFLLDDENHDASELFLAFLAFPLFDFLLKKLGNECDDAVLRLGPPYHRTCTRDGSGMPLHPLLWVLISHCRALQLVRYIAVCPHHRAVHRLDSTHVSS